MVTETGTAHGSCDFLTPLLVTLWCLTFPRVLSPSCGRVFSLVTLLLGSSKTFVRESSSNTVSRVSRVCLVCVRVCPCVRVSVCLCVYQSLCLCVCVFVYGHVHVYVYVFVYVYMFLYMYMYMFMKM